MNIPTSKTNDCLNMLIVDDEPAILSSLKGLFRRQFNIETAESGEEALELIKTKDCEWHIVLSDQRMPGINGCELLREVREKFRFVTSVLITGYTDVDDLIKAVNEGHIFGFVAKPWNPRQLKVMVTKAAEFTQFQLQANQCLTDLAHQEQRLSSVETVSKQRFLEFINWLEIHGNSEQKELLSNLHRLGDKAWDALPSLISEFPQSRESNDHAFQ
ncbi:response regulator [Litoribrevibacter euphylliae]|uniref:Response regulator n=1 Tax=Litoribrevibacter euphylliae TaxID=1834034 RepID=A0ABV7HAM7_9GAMM